MRGRITPAAATIAEVLQPRGFSTLAVGKWHLTPMREASAAGPFTDWPLARGFDRYYGFMQGETDQFHPELYEDHRLVDPPRRPDEGYHLSEDLVDRSLEMVRHQQSLTPERPFFLYLAFGATHAPHQAPESYLARWRGAFDEGWDVWRERVFRRQIETGVIPPDTELAPRNPGVLPWNELDRDEQELACRLQEAFAAMLDHTDAQVGRLVEGFEELGIADDTVFVVLSDNGASQEGGATGVLDTFRYFNQLDQPIDEGICRLDAIGTRTSNTNYPWGWAQVGNTPGKRYKQNTHGGGIRDPLIISWRNGLEPGVRGGQREQFHHVTDIVPTLLEILDLKMPDEVKGVAQMPIHGTSMAYTFDEPARDSAAVPTRKRSQYFEMNGNLAIWSDGWKAVRFRDVGRPFDDDEWELYHLDEDFSEVHNLAAANPERLEAMIELFWREADTFGVLPIHDRMTSLFGGHRTPGTPRARDHFEYFPPVPRIPPDAAPAFGSRNWAATFVFDERRGDDVGVLAAMGTVNNGFVIYIDHDGHLVYDHNAFSRHTMVRSTEPVAADVDRVVVEQFRVSRGPAVAALRSGGAVIGTGRLRLVPAMISPIGFDIGRNPTGISDDYQAPFEFTGSIRRVTITTERALPPGEEERLEAIAAELTQ